MLTKKGKYWYGTCGKDIWFALEHFTGGGVFDYHFAVCACGHTVFQVLLDEDAGFVSRSCARCDAHHVMIDCDETEANADPDFCQCLCDGELFEVMGAVSRFFDDPPDEPTDDARTFYLGLRCVGCGCTGCYGEWNVRWVGYRQWLDRV